MDDRADSANAAAGENAAMTGGNARGVVARGLASVSPAERAEFLRLFEIARGRMWLVAAAVTGDRTEADDVVQDAAMIGLAKFSTFSPGTSFDAWMGQITRNVALNATRKRKRIGSMLTETGTVPEPSASVRPASDGQAEPDGNTGVNIGALTEALAGLDDVPRSCLLLRVVGGLPYQAIAAILQIPESTAMSHVFRSRSYLRRRLADRAVPPRATATVQVTAAAKAPDETGVQR